MPKSFALPSLLLAALLCTSTAQGQNANASRYYEDALRRYEAKDLAGSILQLKNALQINREMLPAQLLLGKAALESGDPVAAELAFAESLRPSMRWKKPISSVSGKKIAIFAIKAE